MMKTEADSDREKGDETRCTDDCMRSLPLTTDWSKPRDPEDGCNGFV